MLKKCIYLWIRVIGANCSETNQNEATIAADSMNEL